ncbi:intraflagellar transport protein 43 homolog [Callorhinchus milii]|uniref:Intraflagellar transport protein 43-like protein A n=2 Tax=Callorhinchus milii TaxID=7868 RepID=K4FXY0_CALMI|nr:intraflagellar transport protein 43 homolog [Callorhinchus milii]AFK10742.1 Intraflagellar transport protein 43-like protein A [Callorhinchus milii]|eukprot:gi/632990184/ref/XP_007884048.1/ PREDICTED: intraflagellar transport protein 43 homolog [Callorhinchus milii]
MEEDVDTNPRMVKTGRRARQALEPSQEETLVTRQTPSTGCLAEGPPGKPARRQGGWADDTARSAKSGRKVPDEIEDKRLRPDTPEGSEDGGDIPIIPDLEDVQEEDLAMQVAAPPSIQVNRVMTYRDLDNDLMKYAAFQTLDGEIDLKLLTRVLSAEQEVREEDESWDWELLFTEVASDLLMECDDGAGQGEEDPKQLSLQG